MSTNKGKGPIVDPGLCRCCGALKKCRLLNVEYEFLGQPEVYSDMLVDCFGLVLSHLDGAESERVICATCVVRLRDARAFRAQVLHCERKLLHDSIHIHDAEGSSNIDLKDVAEVKIEMDEIPTLPNATIAADQSDNDADVDMEMPIADHIDSDADSVKSEKPIKLLKKSKQTKKSSKTKSGKKRKSSKSNGECVTSRPKRTRLGIAKTELELEPQYIPQYLPKTPVKKLIDTEHLSFSNAITIVENSYVCPFDTSFSDYYCVYCRQVFTDPNRLREHTLTHDPTTFKDIATNKKLLLIDIYKIDCRLCPSTIDNIDTLKLHLANAHGKSLHDTTNEFLKFRLTINNLTCIECDSVFSFFHALKKHMAEHFGTCICDICGAHYFEERMLILHQKTHQKVDESHPCKECGKVFKSKHSRFLHEAKLHKKEPAYQCYKCDAVLFSYSLRYRHMIEVHGEQRMFQCEHCDRAYDSRKSLREHNRRYHLKIFKHQCDLCEKRFYLPSRLKEHMASHTGERNFRCEYCGKSYPRLRGLKAHMHSHSNEKKFRCVLCNASFTQNVNLKNHMKRQHQSLDMEEAFHE